MHMEPPTVTWPVWKARRGRTTRTKGGSIGKAGEKSSSIWMAAGALYLAAKLASSPKRGTSLGGVTATAQRYALDSSGIETSTPSFSPRDCSRTKRMYSFASSRVACAEPSPANCLARALSCFSNACSCSRRLRFSALSASSDALGALGSSNASQASKASSSSSSYSSSSLLSLLSPSSEEAAASGSWRAAAARGVPHMAHCLSVSSVGSSCT
mmetsp:Transcript_33260/g.84755  ORF Transcript_33260/g.84755 Transcript_33260/m.84755 type:complete len:213 (-) Transcript_33260:57-695(-)